MSLKKEILDPFTTIFYFATEEEAVAFSEGVEFVNDGAVIVEGMGELFDSENVLTGWFVEVTDIESN